MQGKLNYDQRNKTRPSIHLSCCHEKAQKAQKQLQLLFVPCAFSWLSIF